VAVAPNYLEYKTRSSHCASLRRPDAVTSPRTNSVASSTNEEKEPEPTRQAFSNFVPPEFQPKAAPTKNGLALVLPDFRSDSSEQGIRSAEVLLEIAIDSIFHRWARTRFEDGVLSHFSIALIELINAFGNEAVEAIASKVLNRTTNPESAAEALRWIGRIDDRKTHGMRKWLLTSSLFSSSPRVRDGAVLGLGSMDDKNTLSAVQAAARVEQSKWLKDDMCALIAQLQED
jgi:hypothetical protein